MAFQTRAWLVLALSAIAVLHAPVARAATFAVVRWEPDVVTVIDPAAIEPVTGSDTLRRAWSVSVQKSLLSDGPQQPGYVRTLNEYDCAGRKIRWKSFFVYSRFGASVMHKDNDDEAWNVIAPKSEAEVSARLVCDHDNRWSAIASKSMSQLVITLMQAWDDAAPLPPQQPVTTGARAKTAAKKKPAAGVAAKDKLAPQR